MKVAPQCHKCGGQNYLVSDKVPRDEPFAHFKCLQCSYEDVPLGHRDLIGLGLDADAAAWLLKRKNRSLMVWESRTSDREQEADDADAA